MSVLKMLVPALVASKGVSRGRHFKTFHDLRGDPISARLAGLLASEHPHATSAAHRFNPLRETGERE